MAQELVYTSAEKGLRPGTRGFCTVAHTRGMRPECIRVLESLSAYKNLSAVGDAASENHPVAYSHYRYMFSGKDSSILSRIGPARIEHTGRTNKIAHHVLLSARERAPAGPAWMAEHEDFFLDRWEEAPREIPAEKQVPNDEPGDVYAAVWEKHTGDPGWAGVLAHQFETNPRTPVFLIYEVGTPVLSLFREAMMYVQPRKRWQVTFSTYFQSVPVGMTCAWRGCLSDSDTAREARRFGRGLIVDLTRPGNCQYNYRLVRYAREGKPVAPPTSAAGA